MIRRRKPKWVFNISGPSDPSAVFRMVLDLYRIQGRDFRSPSDRNPFPVFRIWRWWP